MWHLNFQGFFESFTYRVGFVGFHDSSGPFLQKLKSFLLLLAHVLAFLDEVHYTAQLVLKLVDEVRILEFRTYRHEGGETYLFTPLRYEAEVAEPPEHERSWEARLRWAEPEARRLTEELIKRVVKELPDARHMPRVQVVLLLQGRETIRGSPAEGAPT